MEAEKELEEERKAAASTGTDALVSAKLQAMHMAVEECDEAKEVDSYSAAKSLT